MGLFVVPQSPIFAQKCTIRPRDRGTLRESVAASTFSGSGSYNTNGLGKVEMSTASTSASSGNGSPEAVANANGVNGGEQSQDPKEEKEIDIVINNVVGSFSVKCHLNLRDIALRGHNVEYRRENGVGYLQNYCVDRKTDLELANEVPNITYGQ